MVVCRPPVRVYRLTCLDRPRTLGAVKPSRGHRPELQGSDCPTTRLGGVLKIMFAYWANILSFAQ